MKKLLFLVAILGHYTLCNAQIQTTHAKFIILEAIIDGVDRTDAYLKQGAYLAIYESKGEFGFANVWKESQSYGSMNSFSHEKQQETYNTYETDILRFRWKYRNTYDRKEGSCLVELTIIYKRSSTAFEALMLVEDGSTILYRGYVEGGLNL